MDEPQLAQGLGPAYQKYNEEQFATVKLPGSSESVRAEMSITRSTRLRHVIQTIVSEFNSLGDGRYFDTASQSSFAFDHTTQVSDSSFKVLKGAN